MGVKVMPTTRRQRLSCVMRPHYVYMLASRAGVLYVGMTNGLRRRVHELRASKVGFTAAYHVHRLVYFEVTDDPSAAIAREKELKRWTRKKKLALIQRCNPLCRDLAASWFAEQPLSS